LAGTGTARPTALARPVRIETPNQNRPNGVRQGCYPYDLDDLAETSPGAHVRERVCRVVESHRFQQFIIAVILVNAAVLGAETSPYVVVRYGEVLSAIDHVALGVFIAELAAKLYAYRLRFFCDPWNIFDTVIIGLSVPFAGGGISVVRALRVLRTLRLISVVPSLRRVVTALLNAIPGMTSIILLLGLVLYVAAVIGAKLYGATAPELFGDLPTSLFTLFQIMTGDAWSDVAREVMEEHPSAWVFFIGFVLICTFVVLNLFIAVVVSAMEEEMARESAIYAEVTALRAELRELREELREPGRFMDAGPPAAVPPRPRSLPARMRRSVRLLLGTSASPAREVRSRGGRWGPRPYGAFGPPAPERDRFSRS